ncbi:MAG: NAD(+)/NADH kinase [Pseudomonadales bacterium]|nr:NAD(+)/NADH kinase [Pseudomonadales bacterium]MCP5183357.1 NAD(+)/NADH kinase [Pseudomonadales bacterium]
MSAIAICVNPMSGRDVRRLAARATNMTHEAKRDIVARIAAGADAMGVTDIYVTREPFRIAAAALEQMTLNARVHVLDFKLEASAGDTQTAVRRFLEEGVATIVSLGGDGTNRAMVRESCNYHLIPLSTGTNNVFPVQVEPTIAGMAAGLQARGLLPATLSQPVKVLHVRSPRGDDVGLIDAVLLERDHVGNLLPFDAGRLRQILLTRAEPDAIGMSPIGGLIEPVYAEEDGGLLLQMGPGGYAFDAPLSPGWFQPVQVQSITRVPLGVAVPFRGKGVLALDGDRDHRLELHESAVVEIRRDGPPVVDVRGAMRHAVAAGIIARPSPDREA